MIGCFVAVPLYRRVHLARCAVGCRVADDCRGPLKCKCLWAITPSCHRRRCFHHGIFGLITRDDGANINRSARQVVFDECIDVRVSCKGIIMETGKE